MTLSIRPIRLKRSIYFRVPNDIVDLIGLEDDSKVTLTLEEKKDRHLLVYSVLKKNQFATDPDPEVYPVKAAVPPANRGRTTNKSQVAKQFETCIAYGWRRPTNRGTVP